MPTQPFKPSLSKWLPFGLRRVDCYFAFSYIKALFLILAALSALIAIGDVFQRFDDFLTVSREDDLDVYALLLLVLRYYGAFIPQLILQYMFPLAMLLAATITATSSFAGPNGNNEFTVLRSVGVSVKRTLLPLALPAFLIAAGFQAGRDHFLPDMVRESSSVLNRLRGRRSNPVDISLIRGGEFQAVAIGWFSTENVGHNIIVEVRDVAAYQRGDGSLGDNDFIAYRAASARLEPTPDGTGYQWTPLENSQEQTFTRFSRTAVPWTKPLPTGITPAMIERQTLGDVVCSWKELYLMQADNSGAKLEIHWRLTEPLACGILLIWGLGLCMGRMLRGKGVSYIHTVIVSMVATGVFFGIRLSGKSLWEAGILSPEQAAWLPMAAAFALALPILFWMER